MNHFFNDALSFFRDAGSLSGLPLMLVGVGLMLFGWRMWKLCVTLAFGAIGIALGMHVAPPGSPPALYALGGAIVLAGLSFWMSKQAIGVLGGLIGVGITSYFLSMARWPDFVPWIGAAIAFLGATAFTYLYQRHMIVVVTAFLGGLCFTGGLLAVMMAAPSLYGTFRSMSAASIIVVPFMVMVPTVMSFFYQVSEIHRLHADS
jgi:hypothetical protein